MQQYIYNYNQIFTKLGILHQKYKEYDNFFQF